MAFSMMSLPSSLLLTLVVLQFSQSALAMTCKFQLGISLSCPLPFNNEDQAFCCEKDNVGYCCNLQDYIVNNTAIIAGVIASSLVLLIILVLCCCCCCSCCLLAKRRQQRGTVLYGPVTNMQPAVASYPLQTGYAQAAQPVYPPAQYIPPPYPTGDHQPPFNPTYTQKP